ncbi:MAG: sodium:solute symporter, partial [Saprospiraceae bacterium]
MSYLDWAILSFSLVSIIGYGLYKTRHTKTHDAFLKGNEHGRWWTVCLGVMATQASGITFLSTPGQGYSDGLRFVQFYLGLPIAMLIICITFIPKFFYSGVFTAYEYLEKRFDLKTRLLTSFLFLIQRGLGAGITLYAPAIILSALFGWDFKWIVFLSGVCVILYTVSGGALAVSKTQTLQMTVMLLGLIFIFCIILFQLKGVSFNQALQIAGWSGKMNAIDFHFDLKNRYNIWSGLIGGCFIQLAYFGTDQSQVQRYLGGKSIQQSRLGLIANGIFKIPMQFFILLTGVMVFVFFQLNSSPLFFNKPVENKILQSPYAGAYQEQQNLLSSISEQKKNIHLQLLKTPEASDGSQVLLKDLDKQESQVRTEAKTIIKKALPSAEINDRDYIFLYFVLNHLPMGLVGLLLAVVFAATMSSTSAELSALAGTMAIDWAQRLSQNTLDSRRIIRYTRLFTVFWG